MTSTKKLFFSAICAAGTLAALTFGYPIDPKSRWELLSQEQVEAEDGGIYFLPNATRTTPPATPTTTAAEAADAETEQDDDDAISTAAKIGAGSLSLLTLAILVYVLKKVRAHLAENHPENNCGPMLDFLVELFSQLQQVFRR